MIVLEGPAGCGIGKELGRLMGAKAFDVDFKSFPDGESRVRVIGVKKGDDVVIAQSLYQPQDKHIMELLFMADGLRRVASKITAVIPYLAYARQNKAFVEGDMVSIETVMKMLFDAGISSIITVEPHKYDVMEMFKGEGRIVGMANPMAKHLYGEIRDPVVVAPDAGGLERASKIAEALGCGYVHLSKERDRETGEISMSGELGNLSGKDAVVVDDMISTGGTAAAAVDAAISAGARKAVVAAAHLLMVGPAEERIRKAGAVEIYGTNSVPFSNARIVDVSEYIAKELEGLR